MTNSHKQFLKLLFLIIIPTLMVFAWSRPAPKKVRLSEPAAVIPPATIPMVEAQFSTLDLVGGDLWAVKHSGSLLRYSVNGLQHATKLDGFQTGIGISFIDEKNGWAYVPGLTNLIWRTTDAGKSWRKLTGGPAPSLSMTVAPRMKFFDKKHGWLADDQTIWRTVDAGNNWTPVFSSQPGSGGVESVVFFDVSTVMFAQPDGYVAITSDAGETWGTGSPHKVDLLSSNQNIAWGLDWNNRIFKSLDRGTTWVEVSKIYSIARIHSLQFISKSEGWAAGVVGASYGVRHGWADPAGVGVVFHTKDGGNTWEHLTPPNDINFTHVAFRNSTTGWLMGTNGLYQTKDGGKTWKSLEEHSALAASEFNSPTLRGSPTSGTERPRQDPN